MEVEILSLDTCVYRDKFENRKGRNRWGLSNADLARQLMNAIKQGKYKLVVSDHLEIQLERQGFKKEFKKFKKEVKKKSKIIFVKKNSKDKTKANKFCQKHPKVEFEDALHAELAIKGNADVMVTQNIRDFNPYNASDKKDISIWLPRQVKR